MVYHPHVQFVVPGGGLHLIESVWKQTTEDFLFPHASVCRVYKAKLADFLRRAELYDQVDPVVWKKKWVVDIHQ